MILDLGEHSYRPVSLSTSGYAILVTVTFCFLFLVQLLFTPHAYGQTVPITVDITSFTQFDNPDGPPRAHGEYYPKVSIAGMSGPNFRGPNFPQGLVIDSNGMPPPSGIWRITGSGMGGTIVPVTIEIWDRDDAWFGITSHDDIIDINANPRVLTITALLDINRGTYTINSLDVFGMSRSMPQGTTIAVLGNGDRGIQGIEGGESGLILFSISWSPPSPPPVDPCSPGRINPNLDTDRDGIKDRIEICGIRNPSNNQILFDMRALGADPCRYSVAVEIDYFVATDHTHNPRAEAIQEIRNAFNLAPVDAVSQCPYSELGFPQVPPNNPRGGVNLILNLGNSISETTSNRVIDFGSALTSLMNSNYNPLARTPGSSEYAGIFYYSLWIHDRFETGGISGGAQGRTHLISLGNWTDNVGTVREQSGTFLHELGHNLGLDHGGNDGINCKPNYLSVMSYAFQVTGIRTLDLARDPLGMVQARLDYSRINHPSLFEPDLLEPRGVGPGADFTRWANPGSAVQWGLINSELDWNQNGTIERNPIPANINDGDVCPGDGEMHNGFNDWNRIISSSGSTPGPGAGLGFTTNDTKINGEVELNFTDAQRLQIADKAFFNINPKINLVVHAFKKDFTANFSKVMDLHDRIPVVLVNADKDNLDQPIQFNATVTNLGNLSASQLELINIFPDGKKEVRTLPEIKPGSSFTTSFSYSIPSNLTKLSILHDIITFSNSTLIRIPDNLKDPQNLIAVSAIRLDLSKPVSEIMNPDVNPNIQNITTFENITKQK